MACCRRGCFLLTVYLIILSLFMLDMTPNAPNYREKRAREFYGPLTRNNILDSAERLFEGKIGKGPEAIAVKNGKLYTGLEDGRIVEINGNNLRTLVKIGKDDCETDKSCGRPLGLRVDSAGNLYVADEVKGIYKVDIKTGAVVSIVNSETLVDGKKIVFADDLVVSKTGEIYFTDASDKELGPIWQLFYKYEPSGRILHYDPKTKKVTTVLDKLYFPNGIELSPDEDYFLFCHFLESSIIKYNLKGTKKGTAEIFIDNLPGFPDNIRITSRGTYWVAFPMVKIVDEPSLWERITCHFTKYHVFSGLQLVENTIDLARKYFPISLLDVIHDTVTNFILQSVYKFNYGLVIEVNSKGEIIRSLHSPRGVLHAITHVIEQDNILYFGSFWNSFVGKLKLN